jgi:hypothetical protein
MHSAGKHNKQNHNTPTHRPHKLTLYDKPPIFFRFSSNSHGSRKLPDDGRLPLKNAGACILNEKVIKSSA